MANLKIILKTGKSLNQRLNLPMTRWMFILLLPFLSLLNAWGGGIQFRAEVDQLNLSQGESLQLKLALESKEGSVSGEPHFNAPDFSVAGSFKSFSMSSHYDSSIGGFSSVNQQTVTIVLSPLKTGSLKISDIQMKVGQEVLRAPDITVVVGTGGGGNPPPSARSQSQSGLAQQPSQRVNSSAPAAFVRAVIAHPSVYKGEQVLVSYYLYHRVRVFNIQVEKYPMLNGFLREDLDMPMMGRQLQSEHVVEKGVPYQRALLARYAAYPLKSGELEIDSISLKYNYYLDRGADPFDDVDPFFGFFQQMSPRVGSAESERIKVQVKDLPTQGRPDSFVGGVGDFAVSAAVDKYEVHENEAVTVTVKVEGSGNAPAIEEPKKSWPDGIELYETKGKAQVGRNGIGEKVFEFLLIPRTAGKITLPPLEFGFFNPETGSYYARSTEAIELTVLPAKGGGASVGNPPLRKTAPADSQVDSSRKNGDASRQDIRPIKPMGPEAGEQKEPKERSIWKYLYWAFFGVLGLFMALVGSEALRGARRALDRWRGRPKSSMARDWARLDAILGKQTGDFSWDDIQSACSILTDLIFNALDALFRLGSRSLSRDRLREILLYEKGLSLSDWNRLKDLLEFTERVQFAGSEPSRHGPSLQKELLHHMHEARSLVQELKNRQKVLPKGLSQGEIS